MLKPFLHEDIVEAGCDEAGRGSLAGPVVASAVILPKDFFHPLLNDSKQLSANQREMLREVIIREAIAWSVAFVDNQEIDILNILRASIKAMHKAIEQLRVVPQFLLIDGNRFYPYKNIKHETVVKGDGIYSPIAAASVMAKCCRDDYMKELHEAYPQYGWDRNKGYGTEVHRQAIVEYGISPYHRKSFSLLGNKQMTIDFRPVEPTDS